MKALLVIVILLVVCVVLFLSGLVAPGRSRRMQESVGRLADKGKLKGDDNAGRVGDMTRDVLQKSHEAADASAEKGRELNRRVSGRD